MEDVDVHVGQTSHLAVVVEGKPDADILWFKVFDTRKLKLLHKCKLQKLQVFLSFNRLLPKGKRCVSTWFLLPFKALF